MEKPVKAGESPAPANTRHSEIAQKALMKSPSVDHGSANAVDLFLALQQSGADILPDRSFPFETLLNSRDKSHIETPNADSLARFEAEAKGAADLAHRLAIRVAQLYERRLGSIP